MQISESRSVMDVWVKDYTLPPLVLVGGAGIGKSQTVKDACKDQARHLEMIRIASLDSPGDLLGLPEIVNGITTFTQTESFKRLENGGVMFLDEINRCKPIMMDSVMQILDERRLANYDLSKCSIVSAMNPDNNNYSVTEMDNAMIDRCLFIAVQTTIDDIVNYHSKMGTNQRIIELIMMSEHTMKMNEKFDLPLKEETPRGVTQLAKIFHLIDVLPSKIFDELVTACIGPKGTSVFKNEEILRGIPTGHDFVSNIEKHKVSHLNPLQKNILLRRVDAAIAKGSYKINRKALTTKITEFGEAQLAYIFRHSHHIRNQLDTSNNEAATMIKRVLKMTQE